MNPITQTFAYTGSLQTYQVTTTATYTLTAFGAQGGTDGGFGGTGGLGASVSGNFALQNGEQLLILVGGQGSNGDANGGTGGGGGGGSFVYLDADKSGTIDAGDVLLLTAGGGGGAGFQNSGTGGTGTTVAAGSGNGGAGGPYIDYNGGGGAGVNGAGGTGQGGASGTGAPSIQGRGTGGSVGGNTGGGYGGGGGGGYNGGGGGGGYSGGNGGSGGTVTTSPGLGGTSYLNMARGTPLSTSTGTNAGNGSVSVTCYATGTLIRVVRDGAEVDVPVEHLRVGDLAVTASGARRPIRWIGSRLTHCASHPRPEQAMPVRIRTGALGEARPARDLVVSPGHSIALDVVGEVLIPASALVNGSTIVQEDVDTVTYWHVELDSHDLLIAEGQPAESYLDMGNRGFFGDLPVIGLAANPDGDPALRTHADFCRPFHADGPLVAFVRERIRDRAAQQGWALSDADPWAGVHVLADGARVEPDVRGSAARFPVPAGARDVWLVSPASSPSDLGMSADGRRLGLRVAELRLGDGWDARCVALDDPLLCAGFHAVDGAAGSLQRWTAGRARLPAALWQDAGLGENRTLVLRLNPAMPALPR